MKKDSRTEKDEKISNCNDHSCDCNQHSYTSSKNSCNCEEDSCECAENSCDCNENTCGCDECFSDFEESFCNCNESSCNPNEASSSNSNNSRNCKEDSGYFDNDSCNCKNHSYNCDESTSKSDKKAFKSNEKADISEKMSENPQKIEEKIVIVEQNLDFKDKYLRMLADVENTKKRIQKEKHETIRFSIENTVSEFLPALDNFENALKFSQSSSEEVRNWAAGFQMILTQFRDVMHNHGIVAFHSEGNIFDPHFHEAMEIVETTQHPDGTIIEEYAKGYKSQLRTIRPAKVKVAKKPSCDEEGPKEEQKNLNKNNPK